MMAKQGTPSTLQLTLVVPRMSSIKPSFCSKLLTYYQNQLQKLTSGVRQSEIDLCYYNYYSMIALR